MSRFTHIGRHHLGPTVLPPQGAGELPIDAGRGDGLSATPVSVANGPTLNLLDSYTADATFVVNRFAPDVVPVASCALPRRFVATDMSEPGALIHGAVDIVKTNGDVVRLGVRDLGRLARIYGERETRSGRGTIISVTGTIALGLSGLVAAAFDARELAVGLAQLAAPPASIFLGELAVYLHSVRRSRKVEKIIGLVRR